MKKFIIFVLSLTLLFSSVLFSGCSENTELQDKITTLEEKITSLENDNIALQNELAIIKNKELPRFEDVEVGYQLEVYPKVAFSYKVSEDCIVHIESITATLTAKNTINKDDLIEEAFYPFSVTANVIGYTDQQYAGKKIFVSCTTSAANGVIAEDGSFDITTTIDIHYNDYVVFSKVSIVN